MEGTGFARVASLDLIRGVAVLGILAINVAGFAGPTDAAYSPHIPVAGGTADETMFAAVLVLFEGKMRTLFAMLFGASILLFVEIADERGEDGERLELRRLGWLAVFGYLHFLLLWWGDILFLYAFAGLAALALRQLSARAQVAAALLLFTAWQVEGISSSLPPAEAEVRLLNGTATPQQQREIAAWRQSHVEAQAAEIKEYHSGFAQQAMTKLRDRPFYPLRLAFSCFGEALPSMLIGMALLRSGFFSGGWRRSSLRRAALLGVGLGGALTLAFVGLALRFDFPQASMHLAINFGLGFPHLLMALGYAAMLALAAPRLLKTGLGQRLRAAGRMALSNYLGTSAVMTALFYGWGLDLMGGIDRASQYGFVLLGWLLMLAWSEPWLRRFRFGPFEWLWRSLTSWEILPLRR